MSTDASTTEEYEETSIERHRDLLEEIASWDEDEYPLAEHAQTILDTMDEEGGAR